MIFLLRPCTLFSLSVLNSPGKAEVGRLIIIISGICEVWNINIGKLFHLALVRNKFQITARPKRHALLTLQDNSAGLKSGSMQKTKDIKNMLNKIKQKHWTVK